MVINFINVFFSIDEDKNPLLNGDTCYPCSHTQIFVYTPASNFEYNFTLCNDNMQSSKHCVPNAYFYHNMF